MVSLVFHSTSTFLLMSLSNFSFFDTCCIHLHISLHLLSHLATSHSSSPILLSSTFLYVLPLVYHDVTRLFLFSISCPLVHKSFLPSISLSICHLSPHNTLTSISTSSSSIPTSTKL